jgi:transcriptional regulator with XRE-family HTH domain
MPMAPATLLIDDTELTDQIKQNPLYIWRSGKGYALRNVAARLGKSQTSVSKWEDGSAYPTDHHMTLIAKMMKVELSDLIGQWRTWYQIKHPPEQTHGKQEEHKDKK